MQSMTVEDYHENYWPILSAAVNKLLQGPCGNSPVVEFERMFTAAYKVVCHQFSELLFQDLINHFTNHLKETKESLSVSCLLFFSCDFSMLNVLNANIAKLKFISWELIVKII